MTTYELSDASQVHVDVALASSCPICNVSIVPTVLHSVIVSDGYDEENNNLYMLNYCTNCNQCFMSNHTFDEYADVYNHVSSAPMHFVKQEFSENITKHFPDFVKIYNDALQAETNGMDSICGVGYRKALEFLVKDYSISKNPQDTDSITKLPLAKCISTYINDNRLKALATASTWLGNDETHYIKKHPMYNVQNLKVFIKALVTFIDSEFAYDEAQSLISPDCTS